MQNINQKIKLEHVCPTCDKKYVISAHFQRHVQSCTGKKNRKKEVKQPVLVAGVAAEDKLQVGESEDHDPDPPDYQMDDGDTPFLLEAAEAADAVRALQKDLNSSRPFFLEGEDEEEEARRAVGAQESEAPPQKPKRKAIGKCPKCKTNYYTIPGIIKHNKKHIFSELLCKTPDLLTVLHASQELMTASVKECMHSQVAFGHGLAIAAACRDILNNVDTEDWVCFVRAVTVSLHRFFDDHKQFALPSELKEQFLISLAHYVRDVEIRSDLKSKLSSVIGEHAAVFDLLLPCLLRIYSLKMLSFTLHHINDQAPKLSETYAVTQQKTDTVGFKQDMHFIGGCNIKSLMGKIFLIKKENRTPEHIRNLNVLKTQFLVGDFCSAPEAELMAWTQEQSRGGLKQINEKALDLFVMLGCLVKDLEHFDGSLYLDEVFSKVTSSSEIIIKWDDIIRDLLPKKESDSLLYSLCYFFSNTWRSGIVGRRKDELSSRGDAPKHATSGVSFRAKLST